MLSIDGYRIICWGMGNNLGATSFSLPYSLSLSSYQLQISSEPVGGLQRLSVKMYRCPVVMENFACFTALALTAYSLSLL